MRFLFVRRALIERRHSPYVCKRVPPKTLKGGGKIAAGRLYVKVDHRRDDELGPTLKSGTVGVKLTERWEAACDAAVQQQYVRLLVKTTCAQDCPRVRHPCTC